MNKPVLPPELRATAAIARPLLSAASGIIGVAGLAYLIGWRETSAYYSAFGAPWITSLLSPNRLAQSSAWVIWITLLIVFTSIYSIATVNAAHHGLRKWAIVTLAVGLTIGSVETFEPEWLQIQTRSLLLALGALLLAISAGLTIGEIIALFKENDYRWHSYYLWLFCFVVMLNFQWAPERMGEALARLDMLPTSSSLPILNSKDPTDQREWRVLAVIDSNAVLINLGKSPDLNEFRVVPIGELQSIRSTRRARK